MPTKKQLVVQENEIDRAPLNIGTQVWSHQQMSSIAIDDTQMDLLLEDVVETLDADGNGEVDLKEFVEGSLKVRINYPR